MKKIMILMVLFALGFGFNTNLITPYSIPEYALKQLGPPMYEHGKSNLKVYIWENEKEHFIMMFDEGYSVIELTNLDIFFEGIFDLYLYNQSSESEYFEEIKLPAPVTNLNVVIETLASERFANTEGEMKAGVQFKVRNIGDLSISYLEIVVYYLNNDDVPFFEREVVLVNENDYSEPTVLKPNYSLLVPKDTSSFLITRGMDIYEWDEGQIEIEIKELSFKDDED